VLPLIVLYFPPPTDEFLTKEPNTQFPTPPPIEEFEVQQPNIVFPAPPTIVLSYE